MIATSLALLVVAQVPTTTTATGSVDADAFDAMLVGKPEPAQE